MHFHSQKHTGFTLVETLVSITILLLVIIGPMTVAQKGIQNAYYANDQVTAVFLAQEAIEGVREGRDQLGLQVFAGDEEDASWSYSGCDEGCAYDIDEANPNNALSQCNNETDCNLIKETDGVYRHNSSGKFNRKVYIGPNNGEGVPVTVEVTWTANIFGGGERSVILQTWLYDHYKRYEN
jgi:type II secretory pathway pseudopilin PulG